ncbi:hypothetical protein KR76_00172 [Pimelobacter simplex]|uniref:Uncharacterized protein n=1 Tax=Nocardioides simplex TaxID=2045 RepID=A0A0C5WZX9_NOCSI|nr:hypothetical protein KR76_00172 [Pimelobacter simplex]
MPETCCSAGSSRWATRVRDPARRPRRLATRKSSGSVSRWPAASTSAPREPLGGHAGPSSDGQARAALPATVRQDGATGAGAHPQSETVHLVTATVVGLVRPLAHESASQIQVREGSCRQPPARPDRGPAQHVGRHRAATTTPRGAGRSWTCGTGRHRLTDQRYAEPGSGVKPTGPRARLL